MRMAFRKYWAIFQTQIISRMAYPFDLAAQSVTILIFLWIFLQLWRTTYHAVGQTTLAGLTLANTLWYLMLAETIVLSTPRLSRTIGDSVKDGSIAYLLNKPFNYLLYQVSVGLGDSLTHLFFNAVIGGALVWLLVGPPPDPRGWPLVVVTVLLAWLINFCFSTLIGLSAFLVEEISAFEWIYSKFILLLGGTLIPLDFYPTWLQSIIKYLPFAYTVYGPARLFIDPSLERFVNLILGQSLWLVVLGSLVFFFYNRLVSQLTINGG